MWGLVEQSSNMEEKIPDKCHYYQKCTKFWKCWYNTQENVADRYCMYFGMLLVENWERKKTEYYFCLCYFCRNISVSVSLINTKSILNAWGSMTVGGSMTISM